MTYSHNFTCYLIKLLVYVTVFSAFIILFSLNDTAAKELNLKWEPFGYAGGGRFTDVAVSMHTPNVILAGSDVAGIFRSEDNGSVFEFSSKGLKGFTVSSIAFHPTRKDHAFALTDFGFHISRDTGKSWTIVSDDIFYKHRFCSTHLISFSDKKIYVGSEKGLFEIVDNMESFQIKPVGFSGIHINAITSHDQKLLVGTVRGVFTYVMGKWIELNEGFKVNPPHITDICSHPDGSIYAVEKDTGLYKLEGNKWTNRPLNIHLSIHKKIPGKKPLQFKSLSVDHRDSNHLFLATHPETWPTSVFRSYDGGKNWHEITKFKMDRSAVELWANGVNNVEAISFSHRDSSEVFLADWWNLWRSRDRGETWVPIQNGLQNSVINDIKPDNRSPNRVFLSVSDNGLSLTEDGGKTWKRAMVGVPDGHAQELEISRFDPNKAYLLMNPWKKEKSRVYIFKSTDGGNSWRDIGFYAKPLEGMANKPYITNEVTNIEIDPNSDDIIYVATNGYGIYSSIDGGNSWSPLHTKIGHPHVKGPNSLIAISHGNKTVLYVSTMGSGVLKSEDRGNNWKSLTPKYNFAFGMAVCQQDPNKIIVALPEKKILLTKDGGLNWEEKTLPGERLDYVAAYAVAFHPNDSNVILVGTLAYDFREAEGVYISLDGGNSFSKLQMPDNLPRVNINTLSFSKIDPSILYIGFNGIGPFKCRLSLSYKDKTTP